MYDRGYSLEEIAEALLLSHEAIRKHLRDYQRHNKLHTDNGGGLPKLDKSLHQELSRHLEENNYILVKDICAYVKAEYGVSYTVSGMTRLLYRIGFVYKKPKIVPGKLDAQKQEEFKAKYRELKAGLKSDEAIYFMDSVHPQYQARARYGWIKKGTNKTLPSFSGWKRKHIVGAINVDDLDLVQADKPKINGDYIVEFLKKLDESTESKSKIYLICDNAGYHKARKVKEYLAGSKIELIFLPPYSPNLNPIERLWKFMHSKATNNRYYENFERFTEAILKFFADIPKYKDALRSLINDNFQTIKLNHFANSSQ
jgi:transposase